MQRLWLWGMTTNFTEMTNISHLRVSQRISQVLRKGNSPWNNSRHTRLICWVTSSAILCSVQNEWTCGKRRWPITDYEVHCKKPKYHDVINFGFMQNGEIPSGSQKNVSQHWPCLPRLLRRRFHTIVKQPSTISINTPNKFTIFGRIPRVKFSFWILWQNFYPKWSDKEVWPVWLWRLTIFHMWLYMA